MKSTEGVGLPRAAVAGLDKIASMSVEPELGSPARTVALTTEPPLPLAPVGFWSSLPRLLSPCMRVHPFLFPLGHAALREGSVMLPLSCALISP